MIPDLTNFAKADVDTDAQLDGACSKGNLILNSGRNSAARHSWQEFGDAIYIQNIHYLSGSPLRTHLMFLQSSVSTPRTHAIRSCRIRDLDHDLRSLDVMPINTCLFSAQSHIAQTQGTNQIHVRYTKEQHRVLIKYPNNQTLATSNTH